MVCSVVPEVFTDFSRPSAELTLTRLFQVSNTKKIQGISKKKKRVMTLNTMTLLDKIMSDKIFVGQNFCHLQKISPLLSDIVLSDEGYV